MGKIIPIDRSVIPACDVIFEDYKKIVKETADIEKIGAYKVGVSFLDIGLKAVVDATQEYTDKLIIYDHQKAGTDIHETPDKFMDSMLRSGIDVVILFPQAGPITEYEWIKSAQERSLGVIVGGEMTHPRYLEGDLSNGKRKDYNKIFKDLGIERDISGYIRKFASEDMYEIASRMGITDFVVPGNKPDRIKHYRGLIMECGISDPVFYSPGFVAQGGKITEGAKVAGERFHAIIGRGIYQAKDIRKAAQELTNKL